MQAQGIRTGDRHAEYDDRGRVTTGWRATGDAVVDGQKVYVAVKDFSGQEGALEFDYDEQVSLTFGSGAVPQPQFPPGTPEYDDYVARLKTDHEPPYDKGI